MFPSGEPGSPGGVPKYPSASTSGGGSLMGGSSYLSAGYGSYYHPAPQQEPYGAGGGNMLYSPPPDTPGSSWYGAPSSVGPNHHPHHHGFYHHHPAEWSTASSAAAAAAAAAAAFLPETESPCYPAPPSTYFRGPPFRKEEEEEEESQSNESSKSRGQSPIASSPANKGPFDWINSSGTLGTSGPKRSSTLLKSSPGGKEGSGRTRTKDKYRVVYSDHQRLELEKEFHYSRYITIRRKAELATGLGLTERQVKIWFQNRRAKERKQLKKRDEIVSKEDILHPGGGDPSPGLQAGMAAAAAVMLSQRHTTSAHHVVHHHHHPHAGPPHHHHPGLPPHS